MEQRQSLVVDEEDLAALSVEGEPELRQGRQTETLGVQDECTNGGANANADAR